MSIELASRRGPIGKGWHAVALREGAENLLGAARVGRGKADARAGRVQWLDVAVGAARGDVLDADGELYQARLELPALRDGDRQVFLQVARARPELPVRMAGGSYPQEVEAELARSEVSLLPRSGAELSHDCSCLDWPGPCRHVAALLYVLVEAVDERPVLLLTLRGLTLEDLVPPTEPSGSGEPTGVEDPAGAASVVDEAGAAGGGSGAAVPAAWDPARTDPARLAEVVGEDVAAVIHDFYLTDLLPRPHHDPDPKNPDRPLQ